MTIISKNKKDRIENIDEIMMLLEILVQLNDIDDLAGNGFTMKLKLINKIDVLIDSL